MMYQNGYASGFNPLQNMGQGMNAMNMYAPRMEIIRVNGEAGVDALRIGPNSEALLLDLTAPIVWLVQTDGAGAKMKTPFDISQHEPEPVLDTKSIDERLRRLEEIVNGKSDSVSAAE